MYIRKFFGTRTFKHGFRVNGTHTPDLNTVFEPSGELNGFPVYRAVGGEAGMYYNPTTSKWLTLPTYTLEDAIKTLCNASSLAVDDGRLSVGEQAWSCWIDSTWQDRSVTITALTAAEMNLAKEAAAGR